MSAIYVLLDRCHKYLASPMDFNGINTIDETKIYEALTPLYECLNTDDTIDGFIKWIATPLVLAFGEDSALSSEGLKLIATDTAFASKIETMRKPFSAEKKAYLESKKLVDVEDKWDFINFANRSVSDVGRAFIHAFKYKKKPAGSN